MPRPIFSLVFVAAILFASPVFASSLDSSAEDAATCSVTITKIEGGNATVCYKGRGSELAEVENCVQKSIKLADVPKVALMLGDCTIKS